MPFPILAFVGAAAASGVGQFIAGKTSAMISSQVDPWLLPMKYTGNMNARTELPGPDMGVKAFVDGIVKDDTFAMLMGMHNIPIGPNGATKWARDAGQVWDKFLQSNYYKLSLAELIHAALSGIIKPDEFMKLIDGHKVRKGHYQAMVDMVRGKYNIEPLIALYNRGQFTKDEALKELRRSTAMVEDDAKKMLSLAMQLPGPSDLIRFAVKDVWNDQIVKEFGLEDEYDQNGDMRRWLDAQGIGQINIKDAKGNPLEGDMAKLFWKAHWDKMSPTQSYQAKWRLRPDRLWKWGEGIADLKPFDQATLELILKRADYTPKERKWLSAINQRVLQFRQAKQLYDQEIIDKKEMYETMLDQGYVKPDAENLANLYEKLKKDKEDKEKEREDNKRYGKLRAAILSGYKEGSINQAIAFNALVSTGMDSADADIAMRAIDIDVNRRLVQQFVVMVKKEFSLGGMEPDEAVSMLITGGLSTERASQYVIRWQRELGRDRRTVNAEKLVNWYGNGYLSDLELSRRLALLGFSNGDIIIYNAEASRVLSENVARIEAARARTVQQQIQATERMQRQAQQAAQRAISHFRTYSSISQMEKWYKAGLLTDQDVTSRMMFLQIPQDDILRYLAAWSAGRQPSDE